MSLFKKIICSAAFGLFSLAAQAAPVDAGLPPDQLIEKVSGNVLSEIQKDPALAQADAEHVRVLVDEHILPYTDFARMTRMSVGPAWKKATDAQKQEIQTLFRQLLTAVYSGALKEAASYKIQMRPNRFAADDKVVIIHTALVSGSNEPIQLDYRLLSKNNAWKIFDVNVGGVWLVENYRSQFASVINSSGIEGLISQLKDRVETLQKQKK